MRALIVVLILLSYAFPSFAQKPGAVWPTGTAGVDYNVTDAKKNRQGPWIRVYGNNPEMLLYRGQFKNNVPVGDWEWYYPTGELMTKMTHINGEAETYNVNYFLDGKVMSEGKFVVKMIDGKKKRCREGQWKLYNESSVLLAEEFYTDSLLNGQCKYYYPSGKILAVHNFIGGVKNGPFVDYYENGKKEREGTYLAGDFDGDYTSWHENGNKESVGEFYKGQRNGTWYYYKSSGILEVSVLYKNGAETKRKYNEGTFKEYYDSQIPKSEYTYENGMKNGPFTEWYELGQYVQVPGTKEDMEMGIMMREKLEGTQVKMQGDYVNDKLEGEVIYYNEKGLITKIEVYEDGVLKETKNAK